jgi:CBS domain-containing protein
MTTIREVMTKNPTYLQPTATLVEASKKMAQLNCGFIPVGDGDKLVGTVTDRDITLAIGTGKDPTKTQLKDVKSSKVLYCYETDDITIAAKNMSQLQIHRLIVLNNDKEKRFTGVVTFGDLARNSHDTTLCGTVAESLYQKKGAH